MGSLLLSVVMMGGSGTLKRWLAPCDYVIMPLLSKQVTLAGGQTVIQKRSWALDLSGPVLQHTISSTQAPFLVMHSATQGLHRGQTEVSSMALDLQNYELKCLFSL